MHRLLHSDECPYVCDFKGCDEKFQRQSYLIYHVLGHTGEEPWACEKDGCFKHFRQKVQLVHHSFVHLPYNALLHGCDIPGCKKRGVWPSDIEAHKRTRHSDRRVKCPIRNCNLTYLTVGALQRHQRQKNHYRKGEYAEKKIQKAKFSSKRIKAPNRSKFLYSSAAPKGKSKLYASVLMQRDGA